MTPGYKSSAGLSSCSSLSRNILTGKCEYHSSIFLIKVLRVFYWIFTLSQVPGCLLYLLKWIRIFYIFSNSSMTLLLCPHRRALCGLNSTMQSGERGFLRTGGRFELAPWSWPRGKVEVVLTASSCHRSLMISKAERFCPQLLVRPLQCSCFSQSPRNNLCGA